MNTSDVRELVKNSIVKAVTRYQQDLGALPAEKFAVSPGGEARSAADFTHECALLNRWFAASLRGDALTRDTPNGWIKAGGDALDLTLATAAFKDSADELLAAFEALDDAGLDKLVPGYQGPTPAYAWALFAATHIVYHDAQLNYIQSMLGDDKMHWK